MASLAKYTASCPVRDCRTTFVTWSPSTATRMGLESDHRVDYGFEDPSPYTIHTCTGCGFTAGLAVFADVELIGAEAPGCGPTPPPEPMTIEAFGTAICWPVVDLVESPYATTAMRWLWAERCLIGLGGDEHDRAACFLRASQHARMAGARSLEVACQQQAVALWSRHLASHRASLSDEERVTTTYLVAELCRRLGDFEDALVLFDKVLHDVPEHGPAATMRELTLGEDPTPRMMNGARVVLLSADERREMWAQLQALDRLVAAG
jgi:hypothetical protein